MGDASQNHASPCPEAEGPGPALDPILSFPDLEQGQAQALGWLSFLGTVGSAPHPSHCHLEAHDSFPQTSQPLLHEQLGPAGPPVGSQQASRSTGQ